MLDFSASGRGESGAASVERTGRRPGISLRGRLVLLVVACTVPLVVFEIGHQYFEYRKASEETGRQVLALSHAVTQLIEAELQQRIASLLVLATSQRLSAGKLEEFRLRAERVLTEEFPGSVIVVLRPDGQLLMGTNVPAGTPLPVRANLDSVRRVVATGEPAISDLFVGAVTNRAVVAIDVPVKQPDGTIAAVLSLNPHLGIFADLLKRQNLPQGWVVSVFDRRGIVVARIPNGDRFVGHEASRSLFIPLQQQREGILDSTSLEGHRLLSAFSHGERFGWAVGIGVPQEELLAPVMAGIRRTMTAGALLLALALLLAVHVSRGIARPIASLRHATVGPDGASEFSPTRLPEVDEVAQALRTAQEERQRMQAYYAAIVESSGDAIIAEDLNGVVASWNKAAEQIFGYSASEMIGQPILRLMPADRYHEENTILARLRRGERIEQLETVRRRKDGSDFPVSLTISPIFASDNTIIGASKILRDITERQNTEEQLRQAQKMEAIGNLTGGMAHDFNNLLAIIVGNLTLARDQAQADDELAELIDEGLDAAWRGADLTRRLLAFARRQPLRPARIEVNERITDIVRLLRRLLGEEIEIRLDLGEDVWPIVVDPAQLEACLANLGTNARDAMPGGGSLIIATANRHLDGEYVAAHPEASEGDFVLIEVSDTGTGMPREVMSRIFEPFFTTKEQGKGSGLGLSMVFGFLRQTGGHISVYSEQGAGTTFRLYLPRDTAEAPVQETEGTKSPTPGGGETVLVVEDNPGVRAVAVRQLRDLGYEVMECERAAEALEILQSVVVDLLFTDVVMPGGLDGVELAGLVRERWPAVKIVLTSGFPQARLEMADQPATELHLLSKPYSRGELASLLQQVLNA